jgi:hypothetical protein
MQDFAVGEILYIHEGVAAPQWVNLAIHAQRVKSTVTPVNGWSEQGLTFTSPPNPQVHRHLRLYSLSFHDLVVVGCVYGPPS